MHTIILSSETFDHRNVGEGIQVVYVLAFLAGAAVLACGVLLGAHVYRAGQCDRPVLPLRFRRATVTVPEDRE